MRSSGKDSGIEISKALIGCVGAVLAAIIGGVCLLISADKVALPFLQAQPTVAQSVEQPTAAQQPVQETPTRTAATETVAQPTSTACLPQTGFTPPNPLPNGEWIYDCLSSGERNWIGQTEAWKAENWERNTGQSEVLNIVVPAGAIRMGLGCNPCTVISPDGTTISSECLSPDHCFGSFEPNVSLDVSPGEIYRVVIFGSDICPSRPDAVPPCSPEIYIWFNLP